jgi:hypothetical protein
MKPDTLRLQFQTVLITYYEDIKGVVSASGCTKLKVVKRKFVDQDAANASTAIAADADAAAANANANANAATPATPPDMTPGSSQSQPTGQQTWQIKKLHPVCTRFSNVRTRLSSVRTLFSNVCTFHEIYEASCALNMSSITINLHVCTRLYTVLTCLNNPK